MKVITKKVPVQQYEERTIGFEADARCVSADVGCSDRTARARPAGFDPHGYMKSCAAQRIGPEADLILYVDGRKLTIALKLDDCPDVSVVRDLLSNLGRPFRLLFSEADDD